MQFIFKNKKIIALVLIVSQLIVNAGMQTFAVSFSKVMNNTLEGMEQPENISTRYYEEFRYESRTYLFNDSDSFDGEKSEIDNFDGEKSDDNKQVDNENNDNINNDDKDEETTYRNDDEKEEYDDSLDDIDGDYEDIPEELDDDGNVINPTTRPNRNNSDEEPEEDEIEIKNENEEPEEDETKIENENEEPEEDETEIETTEENETKVDNERGSQSSPVQDEKETEEEITETETTIEEPKETETTVAPSSEVADATEEETEVATASELDDTVEIEKDDIENEIENDIASISEISPVKNFASPSELMELGGLLGAAPIGGDGTHVHKICGVAEGAPCIHTEVAEHTEIGDYRLIAADDAEIMAAIIDDLIGRVDDGLGNYENVEGPEYLVLGRDIEFDKTVEGNPRDADTTTDFYTINLVRDLYLCLNGHSIKNIRWTSSTNKQLFITNCGAPAEVSSVNMPANYSILDLNVKTFGVNKNIIIRSGRLVSLENAERCKSTFFGTIFDGYNTTAGVQYVFQITYDNASLVVTLEDCEFRNYKNDAGTAQAQALIRMNTKATLVLKNVKIHDNDGIQNHIFIMTNSSSIGKLTTKGRCEIYNNKMSTGTGNANFLHWSRTTVTIEDEGLFIYNNSKTPGARFVNLENSASLNIEENATLEINNNKMAKATTAHSTIFIYLSSSTINAKGNFYLTNNKVINCGTSNTGVALTGIWVVKNQYINLGNGIVKIEGNKGYTDDGETPADDKKYGTQHTYQVYSDSKDATEIFKMISGYKFNPANRIGNIGFPSGQSGKIMKFTTDEVDDPSIVDTVFQVDTYYFKDYIVEVKDDYARAVHRESTHKHKECGLSMGEACTHQEIAAHTEEIMYYELSGDLAISGRTDLIKGFSATDATEYFYLSDDIDNSAGTLISITLLRDVYICLNGHSMKGVRFAKGTKTVHICNCQNNTVTLRTAQSGTEAYMFDCNAYLYGKQNKNIILNSYGIGRISSGYGDIIYIYGTIIDAADTTGYDNRSRAYVNKNNSNFKLENTDVRNSHTLTQVFMYVANDSGGAGGNFTIRDVNVYNMSNLLWQIVRLKGNSGAEGKFVIKGNCSFYDINMTNTNSNLVYADGYTSMTLEEGATLNLYNNNIQSGSNSLFAMASANSKFRMKKDSKLIINNNILGKTTANQGFLLFNSSSHELLGDVIITNNSFHNCQGKTSDYIGAFLASKDANITIGSGKIFIDNNKAYLDAGVTLVDDRAVPQHHMYGFITGKTDLALIQSAGTKFSPETYIPNFAFMGYSAGTIAKWTPNEYEEYYKASFSELIIADTTYTPDFKVVYEENNLIVKSASTHFHKVCGVAETEPCAHTEIAEHTENYQWSAARVDSVDAFVQSITGTDGATGSSYYYLSDDIVATALTTITPKRDVYLCLNGHDLKNFLFRGTKSIYITNCQTDLSTIENKTTNLTFEANVYIYGIDDNILFSSNRVCDVKSNNTESHFFNLIVDGQNADGGGSYATFYLKNDSTVRKLVLEEVTVLNVTAVTSVLYYDCTTTASKAIMKNIEIKDCSTSGQLVYISSSVTAEFKGKNLFHNNIHTSGSNMFHFMTTGGTTVQDEGIYIYDNVTTGNAYQHANFGKKFNLAENATISFLRNQINKYGSNRSVLVYFEDGADINFRGNFEVRDNRVVNAGTQANHYVAAVGILSKKSINIGSGRIIIKDNKCYKDNGVTLAEDSTYVAQHMFNLLSISKDVNLFNVIDGCKLNPETRIEGAAFYSASGVGKIVDWTSAVTDDLDAYKDMFVADKFFNPILDRRVKNNVLVLDYNELSENAHNHKICGVSTRSACIHTIFENHTEGIAYKPISENLVKDTTIFITLLTDQTGSSTEPNYFYLTTDLIGSTGEPKKIQFDVDTYICLNGHAIRGYEMQMKSGKFMNITNCSPDMGSIRLDIWGNLPFSTNTRVYGINRNITLNTPRLCNISTKNNEYYSVILDPLGNSTGGDKGSYHVINVAANSKLMIEDFEFRNIVKAYRLINVSDGVANTDFVFKDVTVTGSTGTYCPYYFGNQTTCNIDIYGKFEISGNNYKLPNSGGGLFATNSAKVTIHDGAALNIINNTVSKRGGIFYCNNGNVIVEAGGKLSVSDNTIYKNTDTGQYSGNTEIVYVGGNQKFTVLGELAVNGNKIVNCGTNGAGSYMSALYLYGANNSITVGNGKITVDNNSAFSNEAGTTAANDRTYKNHHLFQVYSYNTKLVFKQADGTKFNTDSRMTVTMQGIAEGKVVDWNSSTTDNISAYSSIFKTDYFGDPDPMLVVYKNNSVMLVSSSNYHFHKICGAATNSNCTHTLVTTAHTDVEFSRLGATTSADTFVSLIKGVSGNAPEYFYLRGNITTSSEKEVALQRDVYLCLNGYSISGFRFSGNGRKIYICNCRDDKVSTIKNVLSTNLLFATNVQIYGSTRSNVVVNSGRIIDVTSTYANNSVSFYNVDFDGTNAKDIIWKSGNTTHEATAFYFAAYTSNFENCQVQNYINNKTFLFEAVGATLNFKNVTLYNNRKVKYSMIKIGTDTNKAYLNIYGYLDLIRNESYQSSDNYFFYTCGDINVKDDARLLFKGNYTGKNRVLIAAFKNGNINTGENSYFGLVENVVEKFTGSDNTGLLYISNDAKDLTIKGDFEVKDNRIAKCGTSTSGNFVYGIYLGTNRFINIGSGKVTIQNNKAYSDWNTALVDDTKYKTQHMYQLYAEHSTHKTNGIFKLLSGKKFNTESKIEGVAFAAYNYNGNIIKWNDTTVDAAYIDRFREIFSVDSFKDDELDVGYDATNEWLVIEFGRPNHRHKLCGVATSSACLHTDLISHSDEIGYRKITAELDRSTLQSSLAQGGAFVLLDDIDPAKIGDGGAKNIDITLSNDLYLCLNGHSLKGIRFVNSATRTVFITNCSTTKSLVQYGVNDYVLANNVSLEIYGINKNIEVKQDKIAYLSGASSTNQRVRLYSAVVTSNIGSAVTDPYIYIANTSTNASFIEDCDFSDLKTHSFIRSVGSRTFNFKNNTFKNMVVSNYFMSFDSGTTKSYFEGNNIIDNIKYANTASEYFIHFGSYAGNDIKIAGNTTITNCESYYNANHFFHVGAGHVTIDDNSKLTINKNRLYNTAIYGRALLYLGSNSEFNLYGNLEIQNNAFVGTRQSHSDVGLWYANSTKPIIVGSTSIVINNNTTTNYKANVRNLYSYYGGAEGVFSQKAGTKFNAYDTMIGSIALNTEDYTGVVYSKWDGDHIVGYGDVNFAEIFKADTYGGRKGIITARDGEEIVITFGDHFHKVCGTLATMSCIHDGIDDHGVGTTADVMHTYLALRWNDMDDLKNKLRLGGEYFLIRKIKFDTPTVIDLESDLYLCLTSYFVENVIFTSSTGKKAYITTCIEQFEEQQDEEEEEFEEEEGAVPSPTSNMGSKRNERYEVALVATASGIGAMFNSAVELYSPYKLLNVYANKLYESSGSSEPVILSGVNLHNDPKTANAGNYIEITGNEELVLEGVSVSTMSNVGCVVKAENSTLTLCGDINIYRNEDLRSLFDVKSINQKNGSIKVYDNLIKRVGGKQNIIKISTASYLYGALEVTNNKIINADAGNNSGVFAIFNVASPGYIHIGNTKIYMEENNAYSDSGNVLTDLDAYPCHYVYNVYSNNFGGMFVQDKGTSMDASSRVNVSFDGPKYRGTVVKSWRSGDIYDTVFTADHNIDGDTGFNRIRMNVALEGSDVIIDDRIRIYFKEGISEYKKIGNSPISIYQIVSWGDPYELKKLFKWGGRELVGYKDERGVYYGLGTYPKGLVLNRGSITLTALWYHRSSDANIIDPGQKYDDVLIKRDAVIIGGRWVYDRMNKKWMYYLNSNVSENVVDSLFPNGDSGIFVGMSATDTRRYLKNGIYQIYYNGESYFFRFDENGYMITGLSEANGSYYYFTESGVLEGAMQLDPIVMGDKKIIFDVYGRIVREMDPSSGDVQIIRATYQKMEGMDDYYEPIPSLVGWN